MSTIRNTLGMTVLAGALVAPMMAFGQAANSSTGTTAPAIQRAPDGTPGNPPGTAATRAFDRAAGTNTSGAYPSQSDGTPANPPGTAVGRAVDRATDGSPATTATGRAPMTDGRANVTTTGAGMSGIFAERQRVSQIIGSRVYNDRNEAIGEVDDIIMTGTTPTAIVSVGGFLGIGARLVAVPMTDLQWNGERERIMLPGATKEQLQSRPAFDYGSLRRS